MWVWLETVLSACRDLRKEMLSPILILLGSTRGLEKHVLETQQTPGMVC